MSERMMCAGCLNGEHPAAHTGPCACNCHQRHRIKTAKQLVQPKKRTPASPRPVTLNQRRPVGAPSYSRRVAVLERDQHMCRYCGLELGPMFHPFAVNAPTVDHVRPRSRGGSNDMGNLVAACKPCNEQKDDRLLSECGMVLRPEPSQVPLDVPNCWEYRQQP